VIALLQFDPIEYLSLGPLRISPHGIGTAVGFIAGARLLLPATRARGIDDELIYRMLYRAAIGALIGARLAYAINHWSDYADDPLSVLAVWEGGISLFGGIAGGVLAAVPVMRSERLRFWSLMDAAAPGLALGILIGRVGDLVVGDHLGKPTEFFLGFRCTGADSASSCVAPIGSGVHLPALYDLFNASALLVALLILRRRKRWDGFLIVLAAAWYGAGRFIEDFYRIDDTVAVGLSGSQLTALTLVTVATAWLVLARRTPRVDTAGVVDTTAATAHRDEPPG
jgi:phosphatidylglycerol:prolipoprotein diacylglycerol transferase